jgi:hypothetical protein
LSDWVREWWVAGQETVFWLDIDNGWVIGREDAKKILMILSVYNTTYLGNFTAWIT